MCLEMGALSDQLRLVAYSAAYATGREFIEKGCVRTQVAIATRKKRAFFNVAYDAPFGRYATIEKRPAAFDRGTERKLAERRLRRRKRSDRCSRIVFRPLFACAVRRLRSSI